MEKVVAENLRQCSATTTKGWRRRDPCYLLNTCLELGTFHVTFNHPDNACKSALSFHLLDEETAVQRDEVAYSRPHSW